MYTSVSDTTVAVRKFLAYESRQTLEYKILHVWKFLRLQYTTRAGTPRASRYKHFRHSPTSSIVKHKHALRNTPMCGTATPTRRLQGPPLSRKRRVREIREIELTAWGEKCPFPSTGFEPVPVGYAPIMLPITPREQARLVSVETNTSDTLGPLWNTSMHCETLQLLCAGVCVCHNEKKVPAEWQAQQAVPAILQQVAASTAQRKIQ